MPADCLGVGQSTFSREQATSEPSASSPVIVYQQAQAPIVPRSFPEEGVNENDDLQARKGEMGQEACDAFPWTGPSVSMQRSCPKILGCPQEAASCQGGTPFLLWKPSAQQLLGAE